MAAAVRTLTDRELTVSYFARQLLHRDEPMPADRAVGRLAALQAQYSPSPYIALFSRLPGFERDELTNALVKGTVTKATLMRGTLHLVATGDYGPMAAAWGRRWLAEMRARHRDAGVDEEALAASLAVFTAEPRTAAELREHVREVSDGRVREEDLVHYARALVPLVHVPPSGQWRVHGKPSLVRRPGEPEPEPVATALLVRRYLLAYGPAGRADIAHFTGLRLRQIDAGLAELGPLVRYRDERNRELVDLPEAPPPSRSGSDDELPVRFLPKWDAALLSHADRTRMLPADLHKIVYRAVNGELRASYLVAGKVAGTWAHTLTRGRATLTLTPLTRVTGKAALTEEGRRLLVFLEPRATEYAVEFEPVAD